MTASASIIAHQINLEDSFPKSKSTKMTALTDFQLCHENIPSHSSGKSGKIVLPTLEGLCFEKIRHITYLEACGNYTTLHFDDKRQILVCKTLRDVELLLPEVAFVRIHRSHTVHLKHLKKYIRGKGGHVLLQNGIMLTVSTGQKDIFLEAVKAHFS